MSNNNINWDIIFINTLSQDANLFINKKILAKYGCDLALFISFIANQYNYFLTTNQLTEDKMFFATDDDIFLFTNMPRTRITTIKKQAQELGLISIKKAGQPVKTYYKVNFEFLVGILSSTETIKELAYNRALSEENLTEDYVRTLSYRELRLLCKKLSISYKNLSTKENYIDTILKETSLKSLENKEFSPCADKLHTENEVPVCGISANACAEYLPTRVRENCTKYNINQANINQKNIKNHDHDNELDFFENLFKEFGINFTTTNKNSVLRLRKSLSLKDVELYLRETYQAIKDNKDVVNVAALFSSKIAKGERQINSKPKEKNKENIKTIELEEIKLEEVEEFKKETIKDTNNKIEKTDKIEKINEMDQQEQAINESLEKYSNLTTEEQNKIEEQAIELLCKCENLEKGFILGAKKTSPNIYTGMVRKYIHECINQL